MPAVVRIPMPGPPTMSRAARIAWKVVFGASLPTVAIACGTATPRPDIIATKEVKDMDAGAPPSPSAAPSASASASVPPYPKAIAIYGMTTVMILDRVVFAAGSATIPKTSEPILDAIAAITKDHPTWWFAIESRADKSEAKDAAAVLALAKKRGDAIAAYLTAHGGNGPHLRVRPNPTKPPPPSADPKGGNRSTTFGIENETGGQVDDP